MDNKSNMLSVKLSNYVLPETKEYKKGNYITWGKNHTLPKELIAALDKSATHSGIVTSLAQQLAGNGFQDNNTIVNADGETVSEILTKVALDFEIFGSFALELHWNLDRTKIVNMYHIDFSTIASGLADENDKVTFYYHSTNWDKSNPTTTPIKSFDPNDRAESRQIFVYKPYYPGNSYYPRPDYFPVLKWIEIDYELASYKVNGLKNRFSAGMIVSLNNGVPGEEEREAIVRDIKENFSGNEGNEQFLVDFAEDKEHAATITAVPTDNSENKYGKMEEEKVNEILKAHRITNPLLVGVKTTGSGFSNNADEIKTSYELFYKTVLEPKQKVLENKFNYLLSYMGYPNANLKIDKILPFAIEDNNNTNPTQTPTA